MIAYTSGKTHEKLQKLMLNFYALLSHEIDDQNGTMSEILLSSLSIFKHEKEKMWIVEGFSLSLATVSNYIVCT